MMLFWIMEARTREGDFEGSYTQPGCQQRFKQWYEGAGYIGTEEVSAHADS